MAKVKQLPAGKSKAAKLKEAAKRKAATKTSTKKKAAAPAAAVASNPTAPESAQAPVSSPTGSLVSPETWQSDQARLQSAAEDADTVDELNQEETNADAEYTSTTTAAAKAAAERKLELSRQKDSFNRQKQDQVKSVNTNMAYRGASRSSAANRGFSELNAEHAKVEGEFKGEETKADNYAKDVETSALTRRELRKGYVAKRRGTLASRAAAQGVYSVGSAPEDSGVTAPTIATPAAPAAAAPVATAAKKKKATNNAAAAKRRIAKKKGKK